MKAILIPSKKESKFDNLFFYLFPIENGKAKPMSAIVSKSKKQVYAFAKKHKMDITEFPNIHIGNLDSIKVNELIEKL